MGYDDFRPIVRVFTFWPKTRESQNLRTQAVRHALSISFLIFRFGATVIQNLKQALSQSRGEELSVPEFLPKTDKTALVFDLTRPPSQTALPPATEPSSRLMGAKFGGWCSPFVVGYNRRDEDNIYGSPIYIDHRWDFRQSLVRALRTYKHRN